MEKGGDWNEAPLVDGVPGSGEAKLASVKKMVSGLKKRKKGGKMLVMSKAPYLVDHDDLLIGTKVSGS